MSDLENVKQARRCFQRAEAELMMASSELKQTKYFASTIDEIDETVEDIKKSIEHITKII